MEKEVRRIKAEELRKESYLLGFLNKNINKGGSGRIQRTLLESKVPLSLEEILEISANSPEGKSLIKEASKKKGARNPFDIDNPTNRGVKTLDYFTHKKHYYKGFPAVGINAEGKYFLTKLSDFPELSEAESLHSGQKTEKEKSEDEYLPTKRDCERIISNLTSSTSGDEIGIDEFLAELKKDLTVKGKTLKSNWKIITEEKLKLWSI